MNGDGSDALRQQVADLTTRVSQLEQALHAMQSRQMVARDAGGVPKTPVSSVQAASTPPHITTSAIRAAPPPISAEPRPRAEPSKIGGSGPTVPAIDGDLERRIGSHLFNRIGIVAVLIGMAWFLKFAFDNHWIGPLGRVIIGLLVGGGLIAWSEWFRRHSYATFSYSLKAIGSGVLYLSLWAAYSLYGLMPSGAAFGAMILVTAWNGYMALVQDAELLALYAIIGGFLTPTLVSTGQNHEIVLFTYVLILDLAVLTLVGKRPWFRLLLAAFAGTQLLVVGWSSAFYEDRAFWITSLFVSLFFGIFTVAPRRFRAAAPDTRRAKQNQFTLTFLPLLNAAVTFLVLYDMLDVPGRVWARPWLAVLFAAFYLALLRIPFAQADASSAGKTADVVGSMYLAFAVVFLTIAIPLAAHGHWLAIGWLVEGAALTWAATRTRLMLLRVLAVGALVLGGGAVLALDTETATRVILNARFAAYLVGIATYAYVARLAAAEDAERDPSAPRVTDISAFVEWRAIAAVAVVAMNLFILLGVGFEIHSYWALRQFPEYTYEQFSYSIWSMLFGGILLAVGVWKRSAFFRWQALLLIVFSIGKVFLFDMSELSQGYRILSFLGLGVLLLAISFVYQRDWLGLRGASASPTGSPSSPAAASVAAETIAEQRPAQESDQ